MWFGATIFALVLSTVVSAPWYAGSSQRQPGLSGHQTGLNPMWQGRSSLTQGFLCDWCVVGIEDAQAAIREHVDQIYAVLNRTSALCAYCPVQDQCAEFFLSEIPQAIGDFLSQTPDDICNEAGICEENATLPGMVMNGLNSHVARDRVIKRMLMRARIMQQKMIRLILGEDYLCSACHDFMAATRELLLDNETQYEVKGFLEPLCDYLPTEYQAECNDFVQSIPALMTMLANDVLIDSTCTELGFCNQNQTKTTTKPKLPNVDILSQLGIPGILPVMVNGQNPFQFPSGNNRQNPFGSQSRTEQNPFGFPSRTGQTPIGAPLSRPGQTRPGQYPYQYPAQSRPQTPIGKWPTSTNTRPVKPQKQKPNKPTPIPDFNLDDIFGQNAGAGILDRLPSLPEMPDMRLPRLPINIPRGSRRSGQSKRGRGQGRRQRSVPDWRDIEKLIPVNDLPAYIPDPIPEGGIIITEPGTDENCEICKIAVTTVDSWLTENAPELQKMISQAVKPFCQAFPSPMKEDCVTDVAEFVQTFIQTLLSKLQPDPVCTWLGVCGAKEEVPLLPTVYTGVEPTTWPVMP